MHSISLLVPCKRCAFHVSEWGLRTFYSDFQFPMWRKPANENGDYEFIQSSCFEIEVTGVSQETMVVFAVLLPRGSSCGTREHVSERLRRLQKVSLRPDYSQSTSRWCCWHSCHSFSTYGTGSLTSSRSTIFFSRFSCFFLNAFLLLNFSIMKWICYSNGVVCVTIIYCDVDI